MLSQIHQLDYLHLSDSEGINIIYRYVLQRLKVLLRDTSLLGATEGQGGWSLLWKFQELHVEKEWAGRSTVSI